VGPIFYILKCEASIRLCALRSQRALTLYTSDKLRCCDRYIQCQRSLAVKPLSSPPATYSQQVSGYCDGPGVGGAVLDCGL